MAEQVDQLQENMRQNFLKAKLANLFLPIPEEQPPKIEVPDALAPILGRALPIEDMVFIEEYKKRFPETAELIHTQAQRSLFGDSGIQQAEGPEEEADR